MSKVDDTAERNSNTELSSTAPPIDELFQQSVTPGSPQFWAAHFTPKEHRLAVRAALCFGHTMNVLTTISSDVIAEKSVWWHEELSAPSEKPARHPITRGLLDSRADQPQRLTASLDAMHHHLHGALMSQQRTELDTVEAWIQYAKLRFGSLHELIALAAGAPADAAALLGDWCAQLFALGVRRAPHHFSDTRVLVPSLKTAPRDEATLQGELAALLTQMPACPPANAVLITHELDWWKKTSSDVPVVFAGLPIGLRGMLASWNAARRSQH